MKTIYAKLNTACIKKEMGDAGNLLLLSKRTNVYRLNTRRRMMGKNEASKNKGCYSCIHFIVCKHFNKWPEQFPYRDDSVIKEYLDGIAQTLAEACDYFSPRDK
jgi:hypothetical protein